MMNFLSVSETTACSESNKNDSPPVFANCDNLQPDITFNNQRTALSNV